MIACQRLKCSKKRAKFAASESQSNFRQKWSEGNLDLKSAFYSFTSLIKVIWGSIAPFKDFKTFLFLKQFAIQKTEIAFLDDNIHGVFILYKLCSMLFFWSSLVYTWTGTNHGAKYFIYMTNWGICLLNFSILVETVIVITLFLDRQVHGKIMRASWICTTLFYNNAVFITVLFWSLLYDFSKPPSYANLYVHGLQVWFRFYSLS